MEDLRAEAMALTVAMLGAELRKEHAEHGGGRANLLRERLRNADRPALADRFVRTRFGARIVDPRAED